MARKKSQPSNEPYAEACRELSRRCPVMKKLIQRVGPCTWSPGGDDHFTMLIRCVISQQISTKAAKSIFEKLAKTVGGTPIIHDRIVGLSDADFQSCGVSGPKQRTLRAVANHAAVNPDLLSKIHTWDDGTIRSQLISIKGIGPWTCDMFLMFAISRMNVLPVGDLGLRLAVQDEFSLAELPSKVELERIAKPWQPYRSVATWYLWRSRGPVPQSGDDK